jgi:hypothetical protein
VSQFSNFNLGTCACVVPGSREIGTARRIAVAVYVLRYIYAQNWPRRGAALARPSALGSRATEVYRRTSMTAPFQLCSLGVTGGLLVAVLLGVTTAEHQVSTSWPATMHLGFWACKLGLIILLRPRAGCPAAIPGRGSVLSTAARLRLPQRKSPVCQGRNLSSRVLCPLRRQPGVQSLHVPDAAAQMLHEGQQCRPDEKPGLHLRMQGQQMPALSARPAAPWTVPATVGPTTTAVCRRVHSLR